ncbi:MAG: PAS domain S-box protein [Deltaproteobacteria bacterium]|nr:PAS domain S-box protein [Deltaproteobacteria bacterium]
MEKSFPLDELVDLEELQSIQDNFAIAAGISSVILSPEGEPLTRFTNPTGFCSLIQSTGKGKERCFRSFMEMGKIALGTQEPKICYCFAHGGYFVAPIMIDGEHKGTMFAGQFIHEKFSSGQLHDLEKIAVEIDLYPGLLVKEAEKMRVVGEDVIRNYSILLFKIVDVIASRGAQAAELIRTKDALERRVQERTAELAEANKGLEHEIAGRKQAEVTLRESEEKFRLLSENSIDCVWMVNTRLRFTYLSPSSLERIMGVKVKQWVGTKLSSHFSKKEFLKVGVLAVKSIKNYKTFDYITFETKMLDGKNDEIDVEISSRVLFNNQGKLIGLQGVTRDITERKKAEKILKDSKIKLQLLYDSSSDAIMLLDEKGFFDCNEAALRLFGCANREELYGRHPADFSPPVQPDGTDSMIYARNNIAVALKEGSKRFEHLHRRLDGTNFSADVLLNAMVIGGKKVLQARVYDITGQKAAETALRESEEKIRMITGSANDAIMMMDHKGNISYWNKAAERMFDYTEEEVIGKNLHALLVPERFHAGFSKGFEGFKETGQGDAIGKTLEVAGVGKNGKEFPVELSLSAVKLRDRWNAIGLIRDISERKAAEEELKKKAEELEAFNRLAVGREFKMIELKKEINALLEKLGKEPGYKIVGDA